VSADEGVEYRNRVAIVGAAVTNVVRRAEASAGDLAAEATDAAIADAGVSRQDIDGIACGVSLPAYASSATVRQAGRDFVDCDYLVERLGLQPTWSQDDPSFPPALALAVLAIAAGRAETVVVNRTLHNPPGRYNSMRSREARGMDQFIAPYGFIAPSSGIAMPYMEYQQRYGARQEHMATLVVQQRKNVQRIPEAYWYGEELTFDEYMSCRMISEPMCLYDNDIPVDGSGAVVITTAERARDMPHAPVYVTSCAPVLNAPIYLPGTLGPLSDYYDGGRDVATRLWAHSGWKPEDVDVVQLYDGFTPLVWFWLETLGFCGEGEAWQFIQDGYIDADGPFPLNSGGGNQGWGRLHGVPHVLETYLQLSGRAGDRQTPNARRGISTYATPAHAIGVALLYTTDPDD
jgi:acetyl-CoA acetyltransferase